MAAYRIVSADSHFVEPPDMWSERIDRRFRDHAPHTVKNYKDREGEFFMCENIQPVAVAGFFGSGKSSEELPQHVKRGFDAAPPSVWNPAERLKEQDRDGVSAEILYTSMGMLLFGLDDPELRTACFSAFNDWAGEYCSYDSRRLIGAGTVTLEDVDAGVKELQRCANKGLRGVLIWGSPPEDKPYSDPCYDPFWAAAQDLEMPVSLHILTGRRGYPVQPPPRAALLHDAATRNPGFVRRPDIGRGVGALSTSEAGIGGKRRIMVAPLLLSHRPRLRSAAALLRHCSTTQAKRLHEAPGMGDVPVRN
jgi:predicted TIM-barrel fold metal-dependent hydrolase